MIKIIPTTKLQQQIGMISFSLNTDKGCTFIVTKHGEAKIVMLPYFDGCDDNIQEYIEDYEMQKNQKDLKKRYERSSKSGKSSMII